MFETAELGQRIDDATFDEQETVMRTALLDEQQRLRDGGFPVLVLFAGLDKAGTGDAVNVLNGWMDPRWIQTEAYGAPSTESQQRPAFWRFWRDMPPRGLIGLRLSAWYRQPFEDRLAGRIDDLAFEKAMHRIKVFEQMLADDGALIVKFWMHLSKKAQKKKLAALKKDPATAWRVSESDEAQHAQYDEVVRLGERMILRTDAGNAPWHIVEGADTNFRRLRVGTLLHAAMETASDRAQARHALPREGAGEAEEEARPETRPRSILHRVVMPAKLAKSEYDEQLPLLQGRLNRAYREAAERGITMLAAFEGWDAGGKGGAIRRVTAALDARHFRVIPIAAPTDEEKARHYLWRFWRHLPRRGRVTIFDRSWYGRVLVERIEGFATQREWMRAYAEINDFEQQLIEDGAVLAKFWLHITKDEQERRFQDRMDTPHKRWKITDDDWRNRARWDDYEAAVHDMIERTSTRIAPWTIVPANQKRYARLHVLRTLAEALEKRLESIE
jgi:polyphosphate:AMP phosphotransferase